MEKKVLFLVLVLGAVIVVSQLSHRGNFEAQGETRLKRFSSYEELKSFMETSKGSLYFNGWSTLRPLSLTEASEGSTSQTSTSLDYSTTNIQVKGVDEADAVKTDGEYIYICSGKNITILKAYPAEEAEILSQIKLNGTTKGIFVNGDRLAVLEEDFGSHEKVSVKTSIKVYDVSDKMTPVLKRNVSIEGYYFNSRMIEDHVYTLVNYPAHSYKGKVVLPNINFDDKVQEIPASAIYYSNVSDQYYTFTTVIAINTQNHEEAPTYEPFLLGATRTLYVSPSNIYITFPNTTLQSTLLWQTSSNREPNGHPFIEFI